MSIKKEEKTPAKVNKIMNTQYSLFLKPIKAQQPKRQEKQNQIREQKVYIMYIYNI